MPTKIVDLEARDIRFPTSRSLIGLAATNKAPDYSVAYVILTTDRYDQHLSICDYICVSGSLEKRYRSSWLGAVRNRPNPLTGFPPPSFPPKRRDSGGRSLFFTEGGTGVLERGQSVPR